MSATFLKTFATPLIVSVAALLLAAVSTSAGLALWWMLAALLVWGISAWRYMARAGEASSVTSAYAPLNDALGALMKDLHAAVVCELDLALHDLQQIHTLLADAVVKLDESFITLNTQARSQRDLLLAMIGNIEEGRVIDSADLQEDRDEISRITDTIHANISLAVRALQFEDIAGQVVTHRQGQLQQLGELFFALRQTFNAPGAQAADISLAHVEQQLARSREMVAERCQQWSSSRHKPVSQESMQVGDIELF